MAKFQSPAISEHNVTQLKTCGPVLSGSDYTIPRCNIQLHKTPFLRRAGSLCHYKALSEDHFQYLRQPDPWFRPLNSTADPPRIPPVQQIYSVPSVSQALCHTENRHHLKE